MSCFTQRYTQGYDDGVHGHPKRLLRDELGRPVYLYGYSHGKADQEAADRPSLEEMTVDPGMEASDPFGY